MKPLNIPELLADALRFKTDYAQDFATHICRIQAAAARAAHGLPLAPIDPTYIYAAMAEILNLSAVEGWHLGVAMAEHAPIARTRRPVDYIAESLSMLGLAYGARVTVPEETNQPAIYLALAFRLLLTLCEDLGFEPADGITRWYRPWP